MTRDLGTRTRARVLAAATVLLVIPLWAALPVGAGDPLGQITEFTTGLTPNSQPNRIADGPDGNLWFTQRVPARIGRITTAGTIDEFSTNLTPDSQPVEIASGPDGNLWFTEKTNPGRIGRITPTGTIDEFTTGLTPNSGPLGIAAGPDGNLWFTEVKDPGRIAKIGAGCVPAPAPSLVTAAPRFTG